MFHDKINVTTLGHFMFYNKVSQQYPMGDGRYYYQDRRHPGEQGPFLSISDCLDNWRVIFQERSDIPRSYMPLENNIQDVYYNGQLKDYDFIEARKPSKPPKKVVDNVVRVDFVNRKRLAK